MNWNKLKKEIAKSRLNDELELIQNLQEAYNDALKTLTEDIAILFERNQTVSVINQLKFKQDLKNQLMSTFEQLENMTTDQIINYLKICYCDGYASTTYSLLKQGIPVKIPLNMVSVIESIDRTLDDIKLSKKLYENIEECQKTVINEVTRGVMTEMSFQDVAVNINNRMKMNYNRAVRIARTEGHKIQQESSLDASLKAREQGADVVKEWDSTLDSKTRQSHKRLDGQIQEVEKAFKIDGVSFMAPGLSGVASEDINCRCSILTRARWAVTRETTKWDGDSDQLIKIPYQEWKDNYTE